MASDDRLRDAALGALDAYRGRADVDGGAAALLRVVDEAEEAPRRREESIVWAEDQLGFERGFAELIYDTAREEHLEPGFAFELVRCGVGVTPLAPPSTDEASVEGAPEWIAPPSGRASVERERTLRASFRRLRGHLEDKGSAEDALAAFVAEPDVGPVRY
jgi:hypothetical protein